MFVEQSFNLAKKPVFLSGISESKEEMQTKAVIFFCSSLSLMVLFLHRLVTNEAEQNLSQKMTLYGRALVHCQQLGSSWSKEPLLLKVLSRWGIRGGKLFQSLKIKTVIIISTQKNWLTVLSYLEPRDTPIFSPSPPPPLLTGHLPRESH